MGRGEERRCAAHIGWCRALAVGAGRLVVAGVGGGVRRPEVEAEHGAASLGRPPPDPAESGRGGRRSAASGTAADDGARGGGGVRRGGEFRTATVGEEEPAPDPDRDREETRERGEHGGKEWGSGLGFRCPQGLVGEVGVGRSNQADWSGQLG